VHDKLVNWQIWKPFGFFVASLLGIRKLFQSPARRTPPAVTAKCKKVTDLILKSKIVEIKMK
jgi:hypothetical protein